MARKTKALDDTAASLAIEAGADVLVVQRMLGHQSASTTLQVYSHLWDRSLDEVAERMSEGGAEVGGVPAGSALRFVAFEYAMRAIASWAANHGRARCRGDAFTALPRSCELILQPALLHVLLHAGSPRSSSSQTQTPSSTQKASQNAANTHNATIIWEQPLNSSPAPAFSAPASTPAPLAAALTNVPTVEDLWIPPVRHHSVSHSSVVANDLRHGRQSTPPKGAPRAHRDSEGRPSAHEGRSQYLTFTHSPLLFGSPRSQ